jgi:hypothetical protein
MSEEDNTSMQSNDSTTLNRNGNSNGNGHMPLARPMNAAVRDHLAWWLRVVRDYDDAAPYLVTYRGVTFAASPEEAVRVLSWGGRIEQVTYRPRNGNHH